MPAAAPPPATPRRTRAARTWCSATPRGPPTATTTGSASAPRRSGLNGGGIADAAGNAAALGLGAHAVTDAAGFAVNGSAADALPPTVTGVSLSGIANGAGGVFRVGDVIRIRVRFSEPVTVTGTPLLVLAVGSGSGSAGYSAADSSGADLVFRYTVRVADLDNDGIGIGASALDLNNGTIVDGGNNAASPGLGAHAVANAAGFAVNGGASDGVGPTVTG